MYYFFMFLSVLICVAELASNFGNITKQALSLLATGIVIFILYKMNAQKRIREMKDLQVLKAQTVLQQQQNSRLANLQSNFNVGPINFKNIGGSGYLLKEEQALSVGLTKDSLVLISKDDKLKTIDISFNEINEIEISGPGTVVTNAGVSGGGFGLEGFLKGAAAAAIINAATTKSSTNTFARILTTTGELYLHTADIDPTSLKMKFSPMFVNLSNRTNKNEQRESISLSQEIERLQKLLNDGLLSQDEFNLAKKKLLA